MSEETQTKTHEAHIDNTARGETTPDERFVEFMGQGWAPLNTGEISEHEGAKFAAARREKVSAAFAGKRLVIAAGVLKQRSNDTFYQFRAHTSFSHLTGWGSAAEPGAVLVFDPQEGGNAGNHDVTLYFNPPADRSNPEFFTDHEVGEFWIGSRPSLEQVAIMLGLPTKHLSELKNKDSDLTLDSKELSEFCDELRLVKDSYEIAEMEKAVNATGRGFEDVVANLQQAVATQRGERVVEATFHRRARVEGNWEGYDTIAASGPHACTLHWVRNDGQVREGDLLLLDAGVEVDSLFTADITRTLPINGEFSPVQRKVYEAVLEAADEAFKIVRPGIKFRDVHNAAFAVIERYIKEWGLWPKDGDADVPYHRRYMVHGTSHHLGIDVHDCAAARREMYYDGEVQEGMVFTIEPGLYFHPGDTTVPEEYWGIGVRIEDDIVVTTDGARNLSAHIPRKTDEVEAWVKAGQK
ncbi:MAG: aminopeptidase P family protein [Microbacteriaceae bacterium]|nr:aminopeptidase P family protein [Microbacteriaceae bacterium]